jgi:type IV secretory pathway component VirB8
MEFVTGDADKSGVGTNPGNFEIDRFQVSNPKSEISSHGRQYPSTLWLVGMEFETGPADKSGAGTNPGNFEIERF